MKRLLVLVSATLLISAVGGASVSNAQSDASTVSIADFAFAQPDVSVPVGSTITWTNADSVQHTTSSLDGSWDSGALSTNDSFAYTFNQEGDFAYQCAFHPNMQGTIHVLPA
jgi:plastocyanin